MAMTLIKFDYPVRRIWGSVDEVAGYAAHVLSLDPKEAQGLPISGDDLARYKAADNA